MGDFGLFMLLAVIVILASVGLVWILAAIRFVLALVLYILGLGLFVVQLLGRGLSYLTGGR